MKKIKARVRRINLNMGFWALEGRNGEKYEVINMPEQLKEDGEQVEVLIEIKDGVSTMNMYGTPVAIVGFTTK